MKNTIFTRSLSVQLFAGVLVSLLITVLAFNCFFFLGNALLDHTVYALPFSKKMSDREFSQLQNFVTQEQITAEKIHRLNAWFTRGTRIYLTIYLDNTILYESPAIKDQLLNPEEFDPSLENEEREYAMTLSDGTVVQAFLYYVAGEAFYTWMVAVSGLLAFIVFSFCFVSMVHWKVRYIQKLKKELDVLAGGNLEYPVTVQGQDELGELAAGIDEMRRSILSHQRAESEIRSANSQLVTAMSHDLRTPLTSLLAYLEILDRNKISDEETRRHLISQSLSKTLSIKSMADKLFEYFLVYTSEWEQPDMEDLDADEVFQHFWQEYTFALESHGFTVRTEFIELHGTIETNLDLLRRAFDNLYGNLIKYAEPSQPIQIGYRRDGEQILLTIENTISQHRDHKESTNIGLNTCRRILKMHNGSFETSEESDIFHTEVKMPLHLAIAQNIG